jgi:type IV secretory pathway VirJ component
MFKTVLRIIAALGTILAGILAYFGYFTSDPFVMVKATGPVAPARVGLAAVYLSGDMGFDFGTSGKVMQRLAADGVPVVGVNSATYFRKRRTPEEISAMLSDVISHALAFGRAQRIVLIGQSFGADMLQAGLPGLGNGMRARVKSVALISPTTSVFFQISPLEMLDHTTPDAAGMTSGRLLTWVPTICVYGRQDTSSLCPQLAQANVVRIPLPGGHLMHKDGKAIYAALGAAL